MRDNLWPKPHRDWLRVLPTQLGPRKFRLLASAWCRTLLEPALKSEAANSSSGGVLQREVLAALDASDRFADTGKSKKALNDAVKSLQTLQAYPWPRSFPANSIVVLLLTKDPAETLYHCSMSMQMAHKRPLEDFMPLLRQMVDDLAPAEDVRSVDPGCRSAEVLDLAQSIYQQRQFHRMPELADALEKTGCRNHLTLAHCRGDAAVHIRGCWLLDWILGERISKPKTPVPPRGSKRYQILGRELHETRDDTLRMLAQGEEKGGEWTAPGKPHQRFAREMELDTYHFYAALEHLGYGPIDDLPARLNQGVDRSLEYFLGDWWVGDEDDSRALDKSRPDRELAWFGVLPYALIFCGLTGRWDDAAKICSWFDASIQLENRFELNDYEYQWLYLCIVAHLKPESLEGWNVDEALGAIRKARPKRPRLLADLWEAVRAKDQAAFDKALNASVRHFLSAHAENAPNVNFWVARDESLMWLIAERDGLQFPTLPETLDAAIVRRQTIGLAGEQSQAS